MDEAKKTASTPAEAAADAAVSAAEVASVTATAAKTAATVASTAASAAAEVASVAAAAASALTNQQLGRIEAGMASLHTRMSRIEDSLQDNREVMEGHLVSDAKALGGIDFSLEYLMRTVERIRKPVDATISVRNFLIGVLSLVAGITALWAGVSYLPAWLGSLFHQH